MPAFVRLKDPELLRAAIEQLRDREGSQVTQGEIAMRAGLSHQRISQLARGKAPGIWAGHARALEDVLGVPRMHLFEADEPELIKQYLAGGDLGEEPPDPATTEQPPAE